MANIEIRCTYTDCEYTTEKIPVEYAMQLLAMHNTAEHDAAPPHRKGQADLCQFTKKCTCTNTVRYTDEMVRDVIIRGLCDQDTQRDVLGMQ